MTLFSYKFTGYGKSFVEQSAFFDTYAADDSIRMSETEHKMELCDNKAVLGLSEVHRNFMLTWLFILLQFMIVMMHLSEICDNEIGKNTRFFFWLTVLTDAFSNYFVFETISM